MTESTMFADLLAAQKEMPTLQKTGINPHFKNRYVPLEELLQTVLPILNKYNFVLLQQPTAVNGEPGLSYQLMHVSGGVVGDSMLLCASKSDPQGQGSAITYARRYSLMSLLGLSADVDDDAETTRKAPQGSSHAQQPQRAAPARHTPTGEVPSCPEHRQPCQLVPAGTSKSSGKKYGAFYSCPVRECTANPKTGKGFTVFASDWEDQLSQARQFGERPLDEATQESLDALPFE